LRKQYHFRPSPKGYYAWDVDRLVELTKNFKRQRVKLDSIQEIDQAFWFGDKHDKPTCRAIVEHMQLIKETDFSYPIILSSDGRVMDGMHRVAKALLEGQETIEAVQFNQDPKPDYKDVYPDDLPY
jgi:ParB-like chromosome segregation protein Spo0J